MSVPRALANASPSLSALLAGVELRGLTWCYTDLAAHAGFSVPPGDAVLFHTVLHGAVRAACAGGAISEIGAGESVFVLGGEAHALRTERGSPVGTHAFLRDGQDADIPATYAIGAGPVRARVLSGRLRAAWPAGIDRAALPAMWRVALGDGGPASALLQPDALALAGIGPGASAVLTQAAGLLLLASLRADPGCRGMLAPAQDDPVERARRLIAANPSADWTVERLARSVGMGRSNFAAHFTRRIGRAPMEVVAEHRMDHAAALLREGRLKIAEISEMAGYGSEAAFSRRFTRHFGVSPSQLREQARVSRAEADAVVDAPGAAAPMLSRGLARGAAALGLQRAIPADRPTRRAPLLLGGQRD